jgi:hypothetical protein
MKKLLLSLIGILGIISIIQGQIILQEDFEGGYPADWTQTTNATDNGWSVGSAEDLSSMYWKILDNGSDRIIATNDDACNCDKSEDYLITPILDFSTLSEVVLSFDMFFLGYWNNVAETATIEVSTDGNTWTVIADLPNHGSWHHHQLDLSNYAGQDSVRVAFHYNDHGGFLLGWALDNVNVSVPLGADAELARLNKLPFGEVDVTVPISGTLINNSLNPITQMQIAYTVNGENKVSTHFHGIDIQPFQSYTFHATPGWDPPSTGIYTISVEIETVNGKADDDSTNNVLTFETEILPHVVTANRIDEFLSSEPILTTMATVAEGLNKPTDLDFFPILAKNELWVVNERTENSGGNTLTIYDAGTPDQEFLIRTDRSVNHFMSLPTGIAFSNNFNFATSPGVKDANHSNGTFTGPTLWSSDPEIYAMDLFGVLGSHMDMLHSSPYSMGIASEGENVFWLTDGYNGSVVRYDFQNDHGPGNDDHDDGIVRRYTEISFKKDGTVPSHLVLDKSTGWLYVVDNGNDRVVRLDINSGSVTDTLPLVNEQLAEHTVVSGVTWEVIIDSLVRPSGIDIIENRLLVGDYTTGKIFIYDIDNEFAELGSIATGLPGLTGIKVAPDGAVWYTNRTQNIVVRAEPGEPSSLEGNVWLEKVNIAPNPTSGVVYIQLPDKNYVGDVSIELTDLTGKKLRSLQAVNKNHALDISGMPDGMYLLSVWCNGFSTNRKIMLKG